LFSVVTLSLSLSLARTLLEYYLLTYLLTNLHTYLCAWLQWQELVQIRAVDSTKGLRRPPSWKRRQCRRKPCVSDPLCSLPYIFTCTDKNGWFLGARHTQMGLASTPPTIGTW